MSPRPRLGELRRSQLLDATIEVIKKRGFHATRLEDIAARVGLHPSTILHHVHSKSELLAQALEHAERRFFAHVRDEIAGVESAVDKLRIVIASSSDPPPEIADFALWLDIWSVARTNDAVHGARLGLDQEWRSILEEILEEGRAHGEFAGPTPDVAALAIAALLDGLAIPATLNNPAVTPERMRIVATQVVSSLLDVDLGAGEDARQTTARALR